MITKTKIAEQLLAYLQHRLPLSELVNWAEQILIEGSFEDDSSHTIRNVLAQLALADVKAFGLEYKNCETMMQQLGYTLQVKALIVA